MKFTRATVRLILSGVLGAALILAFVPASTTFADPPTIVTIPYDTTTTISGVCAFDVIEHDVGVIRLMFHIHNGHRIAIDHDRAGTTFTNAQTGASISSRHQITILSEQIENGQTTIVGVGLGARITLPGQGVVIAYIGRVVLRFEPGSSEPEVIFEAGHHRDPSFYPAVCAAIG